MSKVTLKEYVNDRIENVKRYIEFNERKDDKDFFAHKELELYQKAQKYIELTDELGCPLEVVFKALKGINYENEFGDLCQYQRPRLYYSDDLKCWCLELFLGGYVLPLKDYKKTWWLRKDRSE